MKRVLGLIAGLASVVVSTMGCSSFPREYQAAKKADYGSAIAGPWEGEWVSKGGHHGSLRCIITQTPGQAAGGSKTISYLASFEAKFLWDLLTAHYSTPLVGTTEGDHVLLTGDHPLTGLGGGMYHYEAKVTPTKFDATYRSENDAGEFRMGRAR